MRWWGDELMSLWVCELISWRVGEGMSLWGDEFVNCINSAALFLVRKFYMLRCLFEALYVDMRCFGVSWVFSKHKSPYQWINPQNVTSIWQVLKITFTVFLAFSWAGFAYFLKEHSELCDWKSKRKMPDKSKKTAKSKTRNNNWTLAGNF